MSAHDGGSLSAMAEVTSELQLSKEKSWLELSIRQNEK